MPLIGLTMLWSAQHAIKALHHDARRGCCRIASAAATLIISGWMIYAIVYVGFAFSESMYALVGWFLIYSTYTAAVEGTREGARRRSDA